MGRGVRGRGEVDSMLAQQLNVLWHEIEWPSQREEKKEKRMEPWLAAGRRPLPCFFLSLFPAKEKR